MRNAWAKDRREAHFKSSARYLKWVDTWHGLIGRMGQKHETHANERNYGSTAFWKRVLRVHHVFIPSSYVQEQMFTKINKPHIIGILVQRTSTISNQFDLILPNLRDSNGNILVHQTSNRHNFLISQPNSVVQSADYSTLKDLSKAYINFMNG